MILYKERYLNKVSAVSCSISELGTSSSVRQYFYQLFTNISGCSGGKVGRILIDSVTYLIIP